LISLNKRLSSALSWVKGWFLVALILLDTVPAWIKMMVLLLFTMDLFFAWLFLGSVIFR
jgi:uncharacterized membrane protein YobD (UPF0266 family)